MEQAEGLLRWREYDEAERLAGEVKKLGIEYSPFEPKPEQLLQRIDNAKRAGISLDDIKRMGGWKSITMVSRYCGDGNEEEQRANVARMDSFLAADRAQTGAK